MKCVTYARVSSKEQREEGFSIEAQERLLREYARKKTLAIVRQFVDVESAKAAGRTQFNAMVEFLRRNRDIKDLLVEKTDRLYRNFRDGLTVADLDVRVHFVKEGRCLSRESRSQDVLQHDLLLAIAKNQVLNLGEETKKGMREKAKQGEWPGKAPCGYRNDKVAHLVHPDPDIAPAIRRAFESYASGSTSLNKLREMLRESGVRGGKGKMVSKSLVEQILKNPFYYGDFLWAGERYRGSHEPLISRELFESVQAVRKRGGHPRARIRDFAFKGILKCANCGCAIVGEIKKGKYVYYHCTSARGKCDQPYIREESLIEVMGETLRSIQVTPGIVQDIVHALRDFHATERELARVEVKRLKSRQSELQRKLDGAYEDRLDKVIDEGYWRVVSSKWRSEQDSISRRLAELDKTNRNNVDFALEILELSQEAYSLYLSGSAPEKRQLLNSVLSNCTLDGLTVTPTYKKPFNYIAEGLDLQLKLPRLDSNQRPAD